MRYRIIYWLPRQSREFSNPCVFEAKNAEDKNLTIKSCLDLGYEIEEIHAIKEDDAK